MSQADLNVANQSGAAFRADLNTQLLALGTLQSGASEPGTTYAYMLWADSANGLLKQRNAANNGWVSLGSLVTTNLGMLPIAGGTMTGAFGVTAGTVSAPGVFFSGDTNTGIYSPGADTLALATAGTNRLHITSAGLVGIGTSTFSYLANKLVIDKGSTANDGITIVSSTTSNASLWFADGTTGSDSYRGGIDYQHSTDKLYFYAGGQGGIVIDSSGRLGIGTTNLSTTFTAYGGTVGLELDTSIGFSSRANTGTLRAYDRAVSAYRDLGITGANILFGIQDTEKARIDSSGRLLVGTATQVGNVNGGILQLGSGITFPATAIAATDVNTLDDYEEGTFTPTIYGTSTAGTTTYFQQYGLYTKIGRVVTIQVFITITNQTGTGSLRLGGLPFTAGSGANTFPCAVKTTDLALTALYYPAFSVAGGTTYINMEQTPVGGGAIYSIAIDTAFNVELIATYFV